MIQCLLTLPDVSLLHGKFWAHVCTVLCIHTNKDGQSGILQAVHGYLTCMAVFFGSWLCQMMHAFISLYVTVNKIAETVAINNHVRY